MLCHAHFDGTDNKKINGEASTSYFYDEIPYWYNDGRQIKIDDSMPSIPELILQQFPDIKIIIVLRGPIKRAISSYQHVLRRGDKELSPFMSLKKMAQTYPRKHILEYSQYARIIEFWQQYIPASRLHCMIFEEDVIKTPIESTQHVFDFLGIDSCFEIQLPAQKPNAKWSWTRTALN